MRAYAFAYVRAMHKRIALLAEQRPLSVSDGRERAREIDWHVSAQYDKTPRVRD